MNLHDSVNAAVTAEPVDGALLLQRVQAAEVARNGRRLRSMSTAAAAAAAVLVVTVGVPALIDGPTQTAIPATSASPAAVPAGQRAVSWHGVQLFVPQDWKLYDEHCGTAQSNTVRVPGPTSTCLPPYVPGLTVVDFAGSSDAPADAREVDVSGYAGLRGTAPLTTEDGVNEVLVIPDLDVSVSVRSPATADPQEAAAILDTAQVIDVDRLGCATRLESTTPLLPTVPGAADRVLPGEPEKVALCDYGDLRLERSGLLTAELVRSIQKGLDGAPVGTTPSGVGISVSAELCPEYDRAPLVLQASYADGSQLQVFTRLNSCTGPDPDNGARQVRLDVETLLDIGFGDALTATRS